MVCAWKLRIRPRFRWSESRAKPVRIFRIAAACFAVGLSSCAELEHQGRVFAPLPPVRPRASNLETRGSVEHKELLAQFGGQYHAPVAEHYLDDILAKLAAASETPGQAAYRVTVLNTPVVNAFALPSGNLYVTRGLLALAGDASEAAAVMAHEIAHVTANHSALRAEREREAAVISQAAAVIQNKQKGEEIRSSQRLSVASFSRQQELDADAMGVRVVARAGYDPYGASRFLTALGRSSELRAALYGKKRSALDFDIMATHPSTPDRIQKAVGAARQISAPGIGVRDRAGYLAAISGMTFGDDPSEGFVRGRKFIHPRLRFTFTAPEGFILENSNEAVFGVADGGKEALRLDSVHAPAGQTLESYIESGWVDGLLASSVKRIELNGLPAVVATARAGEWNFRLAAVQLGDDIYRLIFAVKSLDDAMERKFMESIRTFRKIAPEEVVDVRSLKIAVVTAAPEDSIQTMAERMVVPNRPAEYFSLLNGLQDGEALALGEKYKIVNE
jgi:predicted Zn-dependent protease